MKFNTVSHIIKTCQICACLLIYSLDVSYSQIIYTDIPDATPNASYSLDLNNDSIADFMIQYVSSDRLFCFPLQNNSYSGNWVNGDYLPWALPSSVYICDTLITWYDSSHAGNMAWGTNLGYWPGAVDKYLALKLKVGTNVHYGWARLDLHASASSFTIKDYAYHSMPNACIMTGQSTLDKVEWSSSTTISICPYPFCPATTIYINQSLPHASLFIYNSIGQLVKQVDNIVGDRLVVSSDELTSGIYIVRVIAENKTLAIEKFSISETY